MYRFPVTALGDALSLRGKGALTDWERGCNVWRPTTEQGIRRYTLPGDGLRAQTVWFAKDKTGSGPYYRPQLQWWATDVALKASSAEWIKHKI